MAEKEKQLDITDKQLDIMHEYVKNMDAYNLIALKGQLMKKLKNEGKSKKEIFNVIELCGNSLTEVKKRLDKKWIY